MACCLGPALGALCMAVVLGVQALCLGDGGVLAWGANVINMALVPAGLIWMTKRYSPVNQESRSAGGTDLSVLLRIGALSVASVLLAAGLIVAEVALFRGSAELENLGPFALRMLSLHALIGLGEAIATCAAVVALGGLAPLH